MMPFIHRTVAIIAVLCIATFFVSTILAELFGSYETIIMVKGLIVTPGLFILIPVVAMTGITGFILSKSRQGRLVQIKKKRMPFIGINGVFILIPCAITLEYWASAGTFHTSFYIVQAIELIAGATNLWLMSLNIRDGMRLGGRSRNK